MKKIVVVNNNTLHLEKLLEILPSPPSVFSWKEVSLDTTRDADLIILTGGTHIPNVQGNEESFAQEFEIINQSTSPIIGICLGCELIARTFGSTLKHLGEKRQGVIEITMLGNSLPPFTAGEKLSVYEGHSWAIETLPSTFEIIADSSDGPEIIKHRDLPRWGFQFHPENMTETTKGNELLSAVINQYL